MSGRLASVIAVAAVLLGAAVGFSANARADAIASGTADPALCAPPPLGFGPGEGLNDPTMPPTIGDVRIAMLFVDFADAPGDSTPQSISAAYAPYVTEWYERVSYGRLHLSVQPVQRWLRLPRTLAAYRGEGFDGAFEAAVTAAEGELDFSRFAAVYLILPRAAGPLASTIVDHEPHAVGGAAIRSWVWLSADSLDVARANVLVHETGHVLGLPDLYGERSRAASMHRWDVMAAGGPSGLFAWHRWKLGWLDARQVVCLRRSTSTLTLTPLERPGGTKAVMVRSGNGVVVIEVRQRLGEDRAICRAGVLFSRVDFVRGDPDRELAVPISIRAAQRATPRNLGRCGPQWRVPFRLRRREPSGATAYSVQLRLLRAFADGSYRVRVTIR